MFEGYLPRFFNVKERNEGRGTTSAGTDKFKGWKRNTGERREGNKDTYVIR
jgi:hypothetical protein